MNNTIFNDPVIAGVVFYSFPGYIIYNNQTIGINPLEPRYAGEDYENAPQANTLPAPTNL
jgi:hypothetical protein